MTGVFLHILLLPLYLISLLYCALVKLRILLYSCGIFETRSAGRKVISVGNLTVGGTGKTPAVELIVRKLLARGFKVVVVSRGYGGKSRAEVGVVSNGQKLLMSPAEAGDEPYMLARKLRDVPVLVGSNRFKVCSYALTEFDPDYFILDDGYQHIQLKRDVNILLVDGELGFGNRFIFPRGPLREPLSGMNRADIVLVNKFPKKGNAELVLRIEKARPGLPVFKSSYRPEALVSLNSREEAGIDKLDGARVCALSAIADPSSFSSLLISLGAVVQMDRIFADHHRFTVDDMEKVLKEADQQDVSMIIMTEKDAVKMEGLDIVSRIPIFYLAITLDMGLQEDSFIETIKARAEAGIN
ncbi:MAG: tetraacyldisaccharide 4'-kinase [bacterium]|nr:tetraacyldisaccharide 4'-kinase [bacterium]